MKDKFEILIHIIYREERTNPYHTYISIGQFANILRKVDMIYEKWDDDATLIENVDKHFKRNITPLGGCGENRL